MKKASHELTSSFVLAVVSFLWRFRSSLLDFSSLRSQPSELYSYPSSIHPLRVPFSRRPRSCFLPCYGSFNLFSCSSRVPSDDARDTPDLSSFPSLVLSLADLVDQLPTSHLPNHLHPLLRRSRLRSSMHHRRSQHPGVPPNSLQPSHVPPRRQDQGSWRSARGVCDRMGQHERTE